MGKLTTTNKIRRWAVDRELHIASPDRQFIKLIEEVGELADGINKGNHSDIYDAFGDIYVVLTILAMQYEIKIEDCIDYAYNEIKDRKGEIVNGTFVKESDLKS